MSSLVYGVVTIDQLRTEEVYREDVLDGPNRVATKWVLRVEGVWNPGGNAYALPGNGAAPVATPGTSPVLTDVAITDYLMEPRRQLTYTVGTAPWLMSPLPNPAGGFYLTDALNGPVPKYCKVWGVRGVKTFRISFAVETTVANDALLLGTGATPSVMLNHVWTVSSDLDREGYETRTIRGRVLFRTDLLLDRGVFPDDFRNFIAPPLETGFRRFEPRVSLTEDGAGLEYDVTDRQTATTVVGDASISWIEAYQTVNVARSSLERATISAILALRRRELVGAAGSFIGALIPVTTIDVVCKVWGRQNATRKVLRDAAMLLVSTRLSLIGGFAAATGAQDMTLTEDLAGTYVEMRATVVSMLPQFATTNDGITLPDPRPYFPANDNTAGVLEFGKAWALSGGNDQLMRGTSLSTLLAAALRSPQGTPTGNTAVNVDRRRGQIKPP